MKVALISLAVVTTITIVGCKQDIDTVKDKVASASQNESIQQITKQTGRYITSNLPASSLTSEQGFNQTIELPHNKFDITVSDGDTISFNNMGQRVRVRLLGVDAPEKAQSYGIQSREALKNCIANGNGQVHYNKKDGYGRVLGIVEVNRVNCNIEQVLGGHAWFYEQYANEVPYSMRTKLAAGQSAARQKGIGLWHETNPQAPWVWRKLNK